MTGGRDHEQLRRHLLERRVVFFAGSGGVGKTTVAAATALEGALLGRRVLALTIDPAQRLADALGIEATGGDITEIDLLGLPERVRRRAVPGGRLAALMLDQKRACDELVERLAPSQEVCDRVMANRIYQAASNSLAGTQEYVALGKLYDLLKRDDFDLVVVDTAPTEHALDFFEAPMRLFNIFDSRIMKMLRMPADALSRFGGATLQKGIDALLESLERTVGMSFFGDIAQFAAAIEEITVGFRERARIIHDILQDPAQTVFGIVCSPRPVSVNEALVLYEKLDRLGMNFGFFIINKVHPAYGPDVFDAVRLNATSLGVDPGTLQQLMDAHRYVAARWREDRRNIEELRRRAALEVATIEIPFLSHDVCDLEGLAILADYLMGVRSATPAAGAARA